jgi:hypothetical protein
MRRATSIPIFILLGLASATAQAKPQCESTTFGGDHRDIKCPLTASGATQSFRFKANFSGGHDDTSARMTATLDGAPLACAQGSKTSLFGEDGDVSLECRFALEGKAGTSRILGVTLLWSHAQYTDFALASD